MPPHGESGGSLSSGSEPNGQTFPSRPCAPVPMSRYRKQTVLRMLMSRRSGSRRLPIASRLADPALPLYWPLLGVSRASEIFGMAARPVRGKKLYAPGDFAPVTGIYAVLHSEHRPEHPVIAIR